MATTVPVVFAADFADDQLLLLEIPNDSIEEMLANPPADKSVCFKACGDKQEVVFCSATKTYSVRKVETSNTVLLLEKTNAVPATAQAANTPPKKRSKIDTEKAPASAAKKSASSGLKLNATSSVTFHYELSQIKPKLRQLRDVLLKCPYRGHASEGDTHDVETGFAALEEQVQASAAEIKSALVTLFALEINGRWRVVAEEVLREHFASVLTAIEANDWPVSAVPVTECLAELAGDHEALLVRHCFTVFGTKDQPEDGNTARLCTKKIGIFLAKQILRDNQSQDSWVTNDFMVDWESRMPSDCPPSVDWLVEEGVMLVDGHSLRKFPDDIAEDTAKLFENLFEFHPRYTAAQLQPFVRLLVGPGADAAEVLQQNTRHTTDASGTQLFSKR